MRTQVAIVGAGPAGLLLGRLLFQRGIENVVLEARDRDHVEHRVRAGVLEQGTVDVLRAAGVADRLERQGMVHEGLELRFGGHGHRIDLKALTGGATITVYGQQEVVKDLIAARVESGDPLHFEVAGVTLHDVETDHPAVRFRSRGEDVELRCDVIAGCDGFHGVCRPAIPDGVLSVFERDYPFAWLGILARARPSSDELIYASSDRGFALHSMRTPEITRLYLQCSPDEDLGNWSDERIWKELQARLDGDDGFRLDTGEILERGVTPMRSFVVEPMQHGRLFLAGDAAHIVPPTGAKGMNLAIADVTVLAEALEAFFADGDPSGLEGYSERCLRRVWRAEHFSWFMTSMLHRPPGQDPFEARLQRSQLRYLTSSRAAATMLAENYVGIARA
jgi:p-hydroxybenzoate 3-monooxygenase